MNTYADKIQDNKSQSVANTAPKKRNSNELILQFVDNRPEAMVQRKLQEMANYSPRVPRLRAFQNMTNKSPQAKQTAQLQAVANNHSLVQPQRIRKKENSTGLPDNLKTGMENLSGMSLDDVKVHRNSDKPAQLQAHAYAQGTDIHLGPGQEKYLPHEAWHVVQQKQGRVKPTMLMKGKVNINDDAGLETEADVMGQKAQNIPFTKMSVINSVEKKTIQNKTVQLISRVKQWESVKAYFESNKVGKARLGSDATWGAMVRFCIGVPEDFKKTHTVQEVLDEAAKIKRFSFEDWKGTQKQGTSQEAQHLVSSTYATKILNWSYNQINSENNFKMLLAGRKGKGDKTSEAYGKAKKERHYIARYNPLSNADKESRGFRHIGPKGIAHPKYQEAIEKLVEDYYKKNNLTMGKPISNDHAKAIQDILRDWHKKGDKGNNGGESIDERSMIDPPKLPEEGNCNIM